MLELSVEWELLIRRYKMGDSHTDRCLMRWGIFHPIRTSFETANHAYIHFSQGKMSRMFLGHTTFLSFLLKEKPILMKRRTKAKIHHEGEKLKRKRSMYYVEISQPLNRVKVIFTVSNAKARFFRIVLV